jgi:hypothetical protein
VGGREREEGWRGERREGSHRGGNGMEWKEREKGSERKEGVEKRELRNNMGKERKVDHDVKNARHSLSMFMKNEYEAQPLI